MQNTQAKYGQYLSIQKKLFRFAVFLSRNVYTAYEKLKNHQKFENTLSHSELIGAYAWFVSWAVPVTEIVVSLLLILPRMIIYKSWPIIIFIAWNENIYTVIFHAIKTKE